MKRTLWVFGPKQRTVRVFLERSLSLVRVSWYAGRRMVKSWPDTREGRAEAKAWAKGFAETRDRTGAPPPQRLTLRALWGYFAEAEFPHLRPRTQQLYREHWKKWELFLGRDFVAEDVTLETVDQFRTSLRKNGIGITHTRKIFGTVKTVYTWGDGRELLSRNRLAAYRFKVAKEEQPVSPAEYSQDELDAILTHMNYRRRDGWRPWAAVMLAGHQGSRMHSILHLQWDDVRFEEGVLTWRARWDKTGKDLDQPLTWAAQSALLTARWWAEQDGYAGPWVFYSSHAKRQGRTEPVYRKDSLWLALVKAERRAGIAHQVGRAMHGFRRGVAGDILAASKDVKLALDFIGDDIRQAKKYLKRRDERLEEAVEILDQPSRNRHVPKEPSRKALLDQQARQESNLQPLDVDTKEARAQSLKVQGSNVGKTAQKSPKRARNVYPRPSHSSHLKKGDK